MRRLSMLAGMMLVVAVFASYGFAFPSAQPAPAADAWTSAGGDDGGDNGKDDSKASRRGSYRDKLEARGSKPAPKKSKEKPKYKPWGEVTKDAELMEGLFNLHKKREDLYMEIRQDQLEKPHVLFMSLSKGIGARFVLGGLPITGSVMFDFKRVEDHVQVRMLNTRFRATDDEALDNSIDLSYGNSIMFSLPIASEKGKDDEEVLLVKADEVFLSDISDMSFWLQLVLQKPVRQDKKKAVFRRVKNFPENTEIEALLTYSPGDRRGLDLPQVPDSRFIEIGVHYSIHKLPEDPMKPRLADDRVGYFMTPYKDFSKDSNESFFVHYINRWRLEKKNPGSAMSEPVKPITFYVDTTIPEKYRDAVAEGIEMWQKAFEAAGFKKAIVAADPKDVDDYDAEDARYNTIRWIVSDEPSFGAIGPSRVDPRTGEIIDSDILMEQNMIANFRKTYRRYSGPEAFFQNDPMLQWLQDPAEDPARTDLQQLLRKHFGTCDIGFGFAANFEFMQLAVLMDGATGMKVPESYIEEAIKFVTAHEVGHTLGLRHNFKSSISTPYEKLNDKYTVSEIGMTGSVMDYPSPNVSRDRSKQGYYYTPSVGTYDQWAISYGYTPVSGDLDPKAEYHELMDIAAQANKQKHAYGTDEDTYPAGALDPNSNIWDLGDKPLDWANERIGVCKDILSNGSLVERVVSEGDNYVPLRNAVETLFIQEYLACSKAIKYVGGQYTARPHRGDQTSQTPLMPVPPVQQRGAVAFLTKNAFSCEAFEMDPDVLKHMADDKLWSWQNNLFQWGRRFDFPMSGWVAGIQNALLTQMLNPMLQQRVVDAQYSVDDAYRLSELYRSLTTTIWYDNMIPNGRTEVWERNLQRIYLNKLIAQSVTPVPGTPWEAIALSRLHLKNLRSRLDQAYKTKGLSDEANAHLLESMARIDRALDAKLQSAF